MVSKYFRDVSIPSEYAGLIKRQRLSYLSAWSETIIKGPGELVYEGYFRHRRKQQQVEGVDKVTFRHFIVQICYLLALRKGFRRKMHFLFYQFKKRT